MVHQIIKAALVAMMVIAGCQKSNPSEPTSTESDLPTSSDTFDTDLGNTDLGNTDLGIDTDTSTDTDVDTDPNDTESSSDTEDTASAGDSDTGPLGECLSEKDAFDGSLFGQMSEGFFVRLWEDQGSIEGGVRDAPPLQFHLETERIGDCRLMTYEAKDTCDEDCAWYGKVCFNGQCVSTRAASYIAVDPVVLWDSKGFEQTVSQAENGSYFFSGASLSLPGAEWVAVDAVVDGEPVSLTTCVPKPLSIDTTALEASIGEWNPGEDLVLRWSTREEGARIHVHMTTGIGTHGGISPVEIECEGQDVGELVIPGSFLTALDCPMCWSCGECGFHDLTRYHTDETVVGGKIVRLNTVQSVGFSFRPSR